MRPKQRQLSVGDDLPHMPQAPLKSILLPSNQTTDDAGGSVRIAYPTTHDATLVGSVKQPYKASTEYGGYDDDEDDHDLENATLVAREMQRLRGMDSQRIKRRRKIWAGAADLLLMALTSYVLARYAMAYMHLSPSSVILSESTQNVSADPLLRTIALLSVALTAYSDLLFLLAAIYLRFSRKRSCTTPIVYVGVLLAVLLQIILSLSNLGIIIAWHSYYTKHPDNIRGATRDVARRCNGQWEFDLVWSAAIASPIANPDDDGDSAGNTGGKGCPVNIKTYHLFIVGAAIRVALFLFFSVLFLYLLGRYNKSLKLGLAQIIDEHDHLTKATSSHHNHVFDSDCIKDEKTATVKESAEMHQLLTEGGSTCRPAGMADPVASASRQENLRNGAVQMPGEWNTATMMKLPRRQDEKPSDPDSTLTGAGMPRLSRFGWQRGEPSTHEPGQTFEYHSIAEAANQSGQDNTAEGWGAALYRRFWGASTGDAEARHHQVPTVEEEEDDEGPILDHDQWYSPALEVHAALPSESTHDRDASKLGVSGWFGREASGEDDHHAHVYQQQQGRDYEEVASPTPRRPCSSENTRSQHQRTASQERRAAEARHQASKKAGNKPDAGARAHSRSSSCSERIGDDLPSMPSPTSPTSPLPQPLRIRNEPSSQQQSPPPQQQQTPSYVRHLGRMVQRMPSILSGDSQTDNGGSHGPSESSRHLYFSSSQQ